MTTTELTQCYCDQAESPFWQRCLRRSVRLQLALNEPGLHVRQVRASLRLVELELRWYLRISHAALAATPEAEETAITVVQMFQMALLSHRAECEALQKQMPMEQYRLVLRRGGRPRPATGCLPLAA